MYSKLSPKSAAFTTAIILSVFMFLTGLMNILTGYADKLMEVLSSYYPTFLSMEPAAGFTSGNVRSLVLMIFLGFIDGLIIGAVWAVLYNLMLGKFGSKKS